MEAISGPQSGKILIDGRFMQVSIYAVFLMIEKLGGGLKILRAFALRASVPKGCSLFLS
jgi:hypothetical protein